jgi:hypothetical protein
LITDIGVADPDNFEEDPDPTFNFDTDSDLVNIFSIYRYVLKLIFFLFIWYIRSAESSGHSGQNLLFYTIGFIRTTTASHEDPDPRINSAGPDRPKL